MNEWWIIVLTCVGTWSLVILAFWLGVRAGRRERMTMVFGQGYEMGLATGERETVERARFAFRMIREFNAGAVDKPLDKVIDDAWCEIERRAK